jgi:hypothetical protein
LIQAANKRSSVVRKAEKEKRRFLKRRVKFSKMENFHDFRAPCNFLKKYLLSSLEKSDFLLTFASKKATRVRKIQAKMPLKALQVSP